MLGVLVGSADVSCQLFLWGALECEQRHKIVTS